jgi:hypothetical protein
VPNSKGQRIVQELDPSDDEALPGRHRAPASAVRRLSVRLGVAALGVILATGLGSVTADVLGLTEVGQTTAQGAPPRVIPPSPEEEPRPGRTVDLSTRPSIPAPQPDVVPAEPEQSPPSAATAASARPPVADAPAPAPVRTVRTGDSCATVGQTATTTRGAAAVCTASRGNGPNKWRAA